MTVITTHCQDYQNLQRSIYLGHPVKATILSGDSSTEQPKYPEHSKTG